MFVPHDESLPAAPKTRSFAQSLWEAVLFASRALALIVIAIYLPALILAGLLVLATSQGPAFVTKAYRRRDGELVYLYEFRTECWSTWRETTVGSFLRRADLHRLPRLANVLMGHVAVGERVQRIDA
jgi:lipopolysaccharide/colanic/teichoic acid biosynthesis glycosyltransferase